MAAGTQDYSTLEAVNPDYEPFQKQKALPTIELEKEVVQEQEKYAISYGDGLEATPNQHFTFRTTISPQASIIRESAAAKSRTLEMVFSRWCGSSCCDSGSRGWWSS